MAASFEIVLNDTQLNRYYTTQRENWIMQAHRAIIIMLLSFFCMNYSHALGQGPIGLWAVTERYVVVADSSLPGIVLVDLATAEAVERLNFFPNIGSRVLSVSSCKSCDFLFVVGKNLDGIKAFWKIEFDSNIQDLLDDDGILGFGNARITALDSQIPEPYEQEGFDPRISLVSTDGDTAYIATSSKRAVFKVDLSDASAPMERFLHAKKHKPFGLNWVNNESMLVTMHKKEIWRVSIAGEVMNKYSIADCPGVGEGKPNLRATIIDPYHANSLIVLASNPLSYDAVIWRLKYATKGDSVICENLAGKINRDSDWVDSWQGGEHVFFSRAHYFIKHPDSSKLQIIVTDIDNRALRIVDLKNGATTSIMYDRDLRKTRIPQPEKYSQLGCSDIDWPQSHYVLGIWGQQVCLQVGSNMQLSFKQAKAQCTDYGARLCEPFELRQLNPFPEGITWTAAPCASCWQKKFTQKCAAIIETHRSHGKHRSPGFSHSWSTGQAIEYGPDHAYGPATFCPADIGTIKAHSVCCADH